MTALRHATRVAPLAAVLTLAGCTLFVDLDDGTPPDGRLIVFDAGIDAPPDGPFMPGDCQLELPCAAPQAGKASVCGRLWDAETDLPIASVVGAVGARCNAAAPTADGPCSLQVRFYDALDFAGDPVGAQPLQVPDGVYVDDCGRYRGIDMPRATFGFIGIGVDDAPGTADRHVLTGVSTSNAFASLPATGFRAYVTRHTTDQAWTTSAGLGGQTFGQRGVLLAVFRYHDQPVAGVAVRRNSAAIPADDYYFGGTTIGRISVETARTVTGANGSALIINSPTPIAHDGVGNEPAGCVWPSTLGASIPGAVFVQLKDASTPSGTICP